MLYLLGATLCSTAIIVIFRLFERYNINEIKAISVNYFVAASFGYLSEAGSYNIHTLIGSPWVFLAIIMGFILIIGFFLFAKSAQHAGVALTAISSRMSVVIPVSLGLLLFHDSASWVKICGIILALLALYLTLKKENKISLNKKNALLPLLLFLAVGSMDSLLKVAQHYYLNKDHVIFLATAFFVAFLLGLFMLIPKIIREKQFGLKNFIAGAALGLINWFSCYFVIKGFDLHDVSVFIPIYNVSVVSLSAIIAFSIFREKLRLVNWIGIAIAIVSIIMIASS